MKLRAFFSYPGKAQKHDFPFLWKTFLFILLFLNFPVFASPGSVKHTREYDSSRTEAFLIKAKKLTFDSALMQLDSAAYLATRLQNPTLLAKVYIAEGDLQMKNDNLTVADSNYRLAYALFVHRNKDSVYLALLNKLAVCSYYLAKNQDVLKYSFSGLKVAQKLDQRLLEGTFYNLLGVAMDGLGNGADAIKYYRHALHVFVSLKDEKHAASVEMNLGVLYEEQKDLEQAEKYYHKALLSAVKIKDPRLMSIAYNNLANIYSAHKNYHGALAYSFKSLALSRKVNDRFTEALTLNNIGDSYQKLKVFDSAFYYYNQALQLAKKIHSARTMSISLYNLADLYEINGDISRALAYATKGWDLVKNGGDVDDKLSSLKQLEKLYAEKGAYLEAYNFLQQYVTIHDSVYSATEGARMEKVRMHYALRNKDQSLRLAREKQKLFRAYLIVSLFALLLAVGIGLFVVRLRAVRNRELEKRMSFVDSLLEYSESYVLILDSNLKISYLSPSYQKAFGHYLENRKGGDPFDFIHPDDVEGLKQQLKGFFSGKMQRVEITFRLKKSSGEYRCMQGVFNNRLDQPELNGYVLNFWDVTELRKTQQAISDSERKYYDIFNAFPDIYFRIDSKGVITEISPSVKSVAGYEREEVLGKTLYDFVEIDKEWPRVNKILQRLQHVKDFSLTLRAKNGKQLYCSLNIHGLRDEEGLLAGFEGVLRDITDRVLAEKQLRKSESELKEANASKDKIFNFRKLCLPCLQ